MLAIAGAVAIAWAYAAAGPLGAAGACAGLLAVLYGARRLSLLVYPNSSCWWCKGTGKFWGSNRKRSGPCWFCGGKPKLRRGARVLERPKR